MIGLDATWANVGREASTLFGLILTSFSASSRSPSDAHLGLLNKACLFEKKERRRWNKARHMKLFISQYECKDTQNLSGSDMKPLAAFNIEVSLQPMQQWKWCFQKPLPHNKTPIPTMYPRALAVLDLDDIVSFCIPWPLKRNQDWNFRQLGLLCKPLYMLPAC